MLWVQIGPPCPSSHQPRGQTEKNILVGRGNADPACPYLFFSIEPTAYPFTLASKYSRQHIQTWRQWLLLYGSPIGPGLTLHIMFLGISLRDAPPPQICCDPSSIKSRREKKILSKHYKQRLDCLFLISNILFMEVVWILRVCIFLCFIVCYIFIRGWLMFWMSRSFLQKTRILISENI